MFVNVQIYKPIYYLLNGTLLCVCVITQMYKPVYYLKHGTPRNVFVIAQLYKPVHYLNSLQIQPNIRSLNV